MQHKNKKRYTKVEASEFIDFSFDEEEFQKSLNTTFTGRRNRPIEAYSKDMYILGNFRLILKEHVKHYEVEQDPDAIPFWGNVMAVEYLSTTPLSCPICLTSPIAPVITRCGHIYCLSCILHLFSLTGYNGDNCPVCLEDTDTDSIRPVLFQMMIDNFKPNKIGHFDLLHRFKGFTVSVPRDEPPTYHLVHWEDYNARYSRFVYASEISYILEIHLNQLEAAKNEADSSCDPELPYVKDAYNRVAKELTAAKRIAAKTDKSKNINNFRKRSTNNEVQNNHNDNKIKPDSSLKTSISWDLAAERSASVTGLNDDLWNFEDVKSSLEESDENNDNNDPSSNVEELKTDKKQNQSQVPKSNDAEQSRHTTKNEYYDKWNLDIDAIRIFYQGYDGSFTFLHPLNVKMLQKQYGHVADFPRHIKAPIIESESIRITERYRHRNPQMGHVPLGADIRLVEVNLKRYISRKVFNRFKDQVHQRNAQRKKRIKREKQEEREQKQREEEEIQHRKETMAMASFSHEEFPELEKESLTSEDFPELPSSNSTTNQNNVNKNTNTNIKNQNKSQSKQHPSSSSQRSFSSAVRQGPSNDWPSIKQSKQKKKKDGKRSKGNKKKGQRGDLIFSL